MTLLLLIALSSGYYFYLCRHHIESGTELKRKDYNSHQQHRPTCTDRSCFHIKSLEDRSGSTVHVLRSVALIRRICIFFSFSSFLKLEIFLYFSNYLSNLYIIDIYMSAVPLS